MEMDDVFFQNIKIPMKKDYERWSSDDARDSPSGYNYFSQLQNAENFSVPSAVAKKDVEELDGCQLSKISSSSSLKSQSCVDTAKGNVARQPLKPVTIAAKTTDYSDLSRLAMCNPPKPVEREAQRRRSQMKANENAHATAPVVKHPVPKRSFSAPRRDSSQTATKRDSSQTAARRDSSQAATRPIAKAATPTNRPVTRSVTGANRIAKELASMKITPSRESRDRSQRVNVSAAGKTQPACAPTKPLSSSFCSAKKTETASTRSAVLRARSADKAARPPVAAPAKPLSRPAPVKLSTETVESRRAPRVPVRIAGATPSKKPAAVPIKTGQHATTSTVRTVRASSLPRSTAVTGTPTGSSKARDSLFNRLATPKAINHPRPPTVSTTPKPNTQPVAKLQDIASLRAASDRLRSQYTRAPAGTVGLKIVSRKTTEQ